MNIVYIIIGVLLLMLAFLALREFFCWYWKINKIVGLLEDIKKNTTRENNEIQPPIPLKAD